MQSAVECTASDSMLELPVKPAATYLLVATRRVAASPAQMTFPVASAMDSPNGEAIAARGSSGLRGRRIKLAAVCAPPENRLKVRAAVLNAMGATHPYAESRPLAIEQVELRPP